MLATTEKGSFKEKKGGKNKIKERPAYANLAVGVTNVIVVGVTGFAGVKKKIGYREASHPKH